MAPSSHGHERGCIFREVLDCDKTKYIEHEWISADCEPVQRCGQCHFSGWKTAGSQQVIRCPEGVMGPIQGESGEPGPETGFPEAGGLYVFVVHGDEESCTSFADVLNTQLKLAARAPYSGSQYDLIRGCWIKEAEPVLIEKETAAKRKATGVYTRLVDAGRLLMDVISRNQGGTNKDLVHFTEQILALCNKWDR